MLFGYFVNTGSRGAFVFVMWELDVELAIFPFVWHHKVYVRTLGSSGDVSLYVSFRQALLS